MTLTEILKNDPKSRTLEGVTKIYHGKENCCRCGCGGKYFARGTVGFTRAVNAMQKPEFKPLSEGDEMTASYGVCKSEGVVYGENYIDVPYDASKDKCYCLYFD